MPVHVREIAEARSLLVCGSRPDFPVRCACTQLAVLNTSAKPLLLVGHQHSHGVTVPVLQLDPDGRRVGQPNIRADGDRPKVGTSLAEPAQQRGENLSAGRVLTLARTARE